MIVFSAKYTLICNGKGAFVHGGFGQDSSHQHFCMQLTKKVKSKPFMFAQNFSVCECNSQLSSAAYRNQY